MRRLLPGQERSAVARRTERKVVLADYYAAMVSAGLYSTYQSKPWPVERAVAEAYERLVYVYKSVEAIAGHASRLPYRLREGEEVLGEHPMYRPLNVQANPMETGRQFKKRLAMQVLLSKRGAFVERTRSASGNVVRLDLLPPGRTYPVPGTGQELISHYEVLRPDGSRQRIETENVVWVREPHPLDAYSGVTPLEAAGLSIELDFMTRLFNVSFLKNDGRPGGIVAIDGELDDWGMAELRSRFGTGPAQAGQLTVVEGQVSYVDVAAKPRDMHYADMSKTSKIEILTAFGVGESVIGYAADRTYENAEQELLNFWTITMIPFLDLLASAFDADSSDGLEGFFDVSGVEVLQRAEIARRAEAREEWDKGLISINEYRERVGREPIDMPRARGLWVPNGKTLIPASVEDQRKIDEETAAKLPPALAQNAIDGKTPLALPPGSRPSVPVDSAGEQEPAAPAVSAAKALATADWIRFGVDIDSDGRDEMVIGQRVGDLLTVQHVSKADAPPSSSTGAADLPGGESGAVARPVLRLVRPAEAKASPAPQWAESVPDGAARDRLETMVAAALAAVGLRLVERTAARLGSSKVRRGTRHWVAEHEVDTRRGDKAVDAAGAVDADRWEEETQQAAHPLVTAAATAAAAVLVADLVSGDEPAPYDLTPLVESVLSLVGAAARGQAEKLRVLVASLDAEGADMAVITEAVRDRAPEMTAWAERVAVQAATVTVNGAREVAAAAVTGAGYAVDKTWISRRDEKVRDSHRQAHGQHRPVGELFSVGEALLRYPGDPSGPPKETYECRCWATHRSRATGRFVPAPEGRTRFTRADREDAAARRAS